MQTSQSYALEEPASKRQKHHAARWSQEEDAFLVSAVANLGAQNWRAVAVYVSTRNHAQCLQRWAKVLKPGLKKGSWTIAEDSLLTSLLQSGCTNWTSIASKIPGRTSKQSRERWFNYLDPSINRSAYTESEDRQLMAAYNELGPRWAKLAKMVSTCASRRTSEAVKIRCKSLERYHASGALGACPQVRRNRHNGYLAAFSVARNNDSVPITDFIVPTCHFIDKNPSSESRSKSDDQPHEPAELPACGWLDMMDAESKYASLDEEDDLLAGFMDTELALLDIDIEC